MDPIDTIDYGVQTIVENQRADALPILPGQTDMHYFKKHLLGTDPSPWTFASTGASCTPSTVPLPEGQVVLKPWAYSVSEPITDSGGWIYKLDFSHDVEENQHKAILPHVTKIRYRYWKRTCVHPDMVDAACKATENHESNPHKVNAYNMNSIRRMFGAHEGAAAGGGASGQRARTKRDAGKKALFSCQVVCECCRFADSTDHSPDRPHSPAVDSEHSGQSSTADNDPHAWSIFVPYHNTLRHFNLQNHSQSHLENLGDTANDYIPAVSEDLAIPDGWAAVRGFSFLVDYSTDDAGWQYSTTFHHPTNGNHDVNDRRSQPQLGHHAPLPLRWDTEHKKVQQHSVKRRFWCRVIAPSINAEAAREAFVTYFAENKRGNIKTDVFFKQGHVHHNWNRRTFVLTDHFLTYKTVPGGATRGSICIDRKIINERDKLGACSEFSSGCGKSFGFTMRDRPPPTDRKSENVGQILALQSKDSRVKAMQMLLQPRMNRGYLNMDALSFHRRLEWVDVLRQQIWLIAKRNGLQLSSTLNLPWSGRESMTAVGVSALNKQLFQQDLTGAPTVAALLVKRTCSVATSVRSSMVPIVGPSTRFNHEESRFNPTYSYTPGAYRSHSQIGRSFSSSLQSKHILSNYQCFMQDSDDDDDDASINTTHSHDIFSKRDEHTINQYDEHEAALIYFPPTKALRNRLPGSFSDQPPSPIKPPSPIQYSKSTPGAAAVHHPAMVVQHSAVSTRPSKHMAERGATKGSPPSDATVSTCTSHTTTTIMSRKPTLTHVTNTPVLTSAHQPSASEVGARARTGSAASIRGKSGSVCHAMEDLCGAPEKALKQSWILKKLSSERRFTKRFIWLENKDEKDATSNELDQSLLGWRLYWVKQIGAYPVKTSPITSSVFVDSLKYVVLNHVKFVCYPAKLSKKNDSGGCNDTEFSLVIKDEYLCMYSSHPNQSPALYVLPSYSSKTYNSIDFRTDTAEQAVFWVSNIRNAL